MSQYLSSRLVRLGAVQLKRLTGITTRVDEKIYVKKRFQNGSR
jgi:hypothetical protein